MKLYVDDDSIHSVLITLLRRAGHDVQVPTDVGLAGESDPIHLTHSIRDGRVLLTRNHEDFEELHDLVLQASGHHPGILVVRQDNDPRRDMTPRGTAVALSKLVASGLPFADHYHVLNHWR